MKKKILMLLLLTITILITLGGLNQTDAARICANCKAGDHINCPNRGYTHNSTSHSIWCCCGKTFIYNYKTIKAINCRECRTALHNSKKSQDGAKT